MNFRRILSKNSLRSSSSSEKNLPPSEEILRLQGEIELFKQTIESLKISVESRDAAIGTLAREKEKLYVELKSVQRTNRNLHQQLVDERDIHSKEKEFLIAEIKKISTNRSNCNAIHVKQERLEDLQSNTSLKDEIMAKDEVIYNICTKYLKVKSNKQALKKKLDKILQNTQKICENVVYLLYENKKFLHNLLSKLTKASTVTQNSKTYMSLLKLNANLQYENTQLKVCLSLRDLKTELDEENICDKANGQNKSLTKVLKQKRNIGIKSLLQKRKLHRQRPVYSTLYKIHRNDIKQFSSIHDIFSPHFRRKKCSSDTCVLYRPEIK